MSTGITPNDIENLAKRVVQANPNTRNVAKKITKKDFDYSKNDVEKIIISYLQRNKYDGNCVSALIEMHPDKKIFDVYYSKNTQTKKEEPKQEEKLDCAACMTFAAEGTTANQEAKETKQLTTSKNILIVSGVVLAATLLLASVTN